MKFPNKNKYKNYFFSFVILLSLIIQINTGIIEPDDIIPLEISPTYTEYPRTKGTQFTFRFYIPSYIDKDSMPTLRGYGATNGQYIGIRFSLKWESGLFNNDEKIKHSCDMIRLEKSLNIPLIAINDVKKNKDLIYCKINSYNNETVLLPGYNYKLTITLLETINNNDIKNLISITIFTSTLPDSEEQEIIDIGTFNHINIISPNNPNSQINSVANLQPELSGINIEVESNFNFSARIIFNEWFSWDDYIICLDLPINQVNIENPLMEIIKPAGSNIEIPYGEIKNLNLESNDKRKYIGFFLDGGNQVYNTGEILLLKFSGLKAKDAGLIADDNYNNNYIGIQIRYRNSYVINHSKNIPFNISLGNVQFTVKHPETSDDGKYKFDVYKSGAFQIEFSIKAQKNIYNKYIVIKQTEAKIYQRVTFIASSCDFSDFNISSTNFNEIPKCNPIKLRNIESSSQKDNANGIFFYYPYIMKANVTYKLKVWMFFDECGPEEGVSGYGGDETKIEIKFSLEMYNDIYKNKFAENRFDSSFIFLKEIITEKGIICYNTYMGEKKYNNGYLFDMNYYSFSKLLYREYFNWNVYDYKMDSSEDNDGKKILENVFQSESITPKFIYSNKENNKLKDGTNLLLVSKITLDSGNNEKLGQFFPMGLTTNSDGSRTAIKGKFFIKLSKNFFEKANTDNCSVSWAFGSPSISEDLNWGPKAKTHPKQKYNFIVSSQDFFSEDKTALFEPLIEKVEDNYLESKMNEGWDTTKALWSFGDEENLEDQISDEAPVDIYFALADTCHVWKNLDKNIDSVYTPIEIVVGIKDETGYSRVMRFIKLYPEGGVWHDNTISKNKSSEVDKDMFIRSSNFIIKNHFAYNQKDGSTNKEKGVCLLEVLPGILDSQRALSSNVFLWIFMGSLLETEYTQAQSPYPVGNLPDDVQAYGYSSQQSLNPNNFYIKPPKDQNSDIASPIYFLANSMTSLYSPATSGYLFYLGSLIVFYNKIKRSSMYDLANDPLLIPYYCPYYNTYEDQQMPYSLGIFPSFIAGFASFESMTNLGNKGFDRILGKEINEKQVNILMLSDIKIYNEDLKHCYNTVKFINDYNKKIKTINIWNSNKDTPCNNTYDSIDSFIFFFNDKITAINNVYPRSNIPSSLKSVTKSKKGSYCFYVYGKKFYSGIYGVTNQDLLLPRNVPSTGDNNPYLSINLDFEISPDLLMCESNQNEFCPVDIVAFWGISANHDMPSYVTNYDVDSFLLDYHIYTEYINNNPPNFELGQDLAFRNDPAIFVKIIFNSPFETPLLKNTILSFTIKQIKKPSYCSVQSSNVEMPSANCDTNEINSESFEISCKLVESAMQYNIFCYELDYGKNGQFYFSNFKLDLPKDETYKDLGSLIFHDTNEYPFNIPNSINEPVEPTIQGNYITTPNNLHSYSKLELTIDLRRPAHPGMEIEIIFDKINYPNIYPGGSIECKISLDKINTYSMNNLDMDKFWTDGNANIYNCRVDYDNGETKITGKLDNKLYKAGKVLSNLIYIYIWPVKTVDLEKPVSLSVKVNDKYILSHTEPTTKKDFSSIDQDIDDTECILETDIISINTFSNIIGDVSDYNFTINIKNSDITLIQIFFPNIINFECEECVKCYQIIDSKIKMIPCNFIDNNILNVFISSTEEHISFIITGIIMNTKLENVDTYLYLNLGNFNDLGNRYSLFNTYFNLNKLSFNSNPMIEHLRFFYYKNAISDNNPRNNATYTFLVSFDYANKDYTESSLPGINKDSLMYIYFPRDYHLYINDNPTGTIVRYIYSSGTVDSFNVEAKILGRKILLEINKETDRSVKLRYIEIIINNIKNPSRIINENKYTGYFKIVCLNSIQNQNTAQYYYITGINSNTYRSNFITDINERNGEYNWHRGLLIKTNSTYVDKLILDVLYDNKTYDFIFLQPGRYTKVHFITTSDSDKESNFYLNPNYTEVSFPNSIVQTLEDKYIIPSLSGEPFEFYIGVPCTSNDGIYVVTPIISNAEAYLSPPSIIVNVRQIDTAKIEFFQDDIGVSPKFGRLRIYYYLSDINVDSLNVGWTRLSEGSNVNIDIIDIPKKSITDKNKKLSNIFSTVNISITTEEVDSMIPMFSYNFISSNDINRCYEMSPHTLLIQEISRERLNFLTLPSTYKLSDSINIITSESDDTLSSNDIKLVFTKPDLQPSFILCEIYCPYLTPDSSEELFFLNFDSLNKYLQEVKQNYFRKYSNNYFPASYDSPFLIFHDVIKGYNYNAQCIFQTTQSDIKSIENKTYYFVSENLHSTFPSKTQCNTFYLLNSIKKETQQKFVNYCQYLVGKTLGIEGCVICSDCSGKIIPPGYSLYFPFNCQKEKCYDNSNNDLLSEMYDLAEDFNSNSETTKYEFTICVTSNRICSSQISEDNLNSALNKFVDEVKDNIKANQLFEIDYNDENYIIYNGFYQNKIYSEFEIDIDDIEVEFIEELSYNGSAVMKASYKKEVSYNLLCFWRIKLAEDDVPNIEEMTNCLAGESYCGIFVANYGGHQYKIPDNRRKNMADGFYSMYITCSHFVPSPVYFSKVKNIMTKEIISQSFSGKFLYINYIYLILFISLLL